MTTKDSAGTVHPLHPGLIQTSWNPDYPFVLVLGTSRSGTSLLNAMIDAHSAVTMASELFGAEILLGRSTDWSARPRSDRLLGFLDAMCAEARRAEGQIWGNKITTEVLFFGAARLRLDREDAIDHLLERLPRTPVAYIVRDGRSAVASKMARAGHSLEQSCRQWCLSIDLWKAMADADWPMTTVRFEGLVCSPDETARSLARALGLPFEPRMLHATASHLLLPEYKRATFDAGAAVAKPLDADGMRLLADHMAAAGYA